ncbi:MAG: DUF6128 domain-containing protein [Lachnospiraceae bacterium]
MQSYKRKITYFYQYHNGNVGSTAGFLKLEIRGDKVKIIINIQEPPGLPYKEASLYFYHEAGDHLLAVKVDSIESKNGILTYQNRADWQQLFNTGRDLYTFDGVAVVYNDSHYYIGDFKDKDRRDYELVRKEARPEKNTVRTEENVREMKPMQPVNVSEETRQEETKTIYQPERRVQESREKESVGVRQDAEAEQERMVREEELHNGAKAEQERLLEGENIRQTGRQEQERPVKARENAGQNEKKEQPELTEIGGVIVQSKPEREGRKETSQQPEDTKEAKNQNIPNMQRNVFEKCENCPYQKRHMERKEQEDAFEKMLEEYPKLPMYGATELFDCVRIHPKDIGKLDMRNWKLGVNSFLTHGFYTYQYLLLGKMRFGDGSERPIIGVPGVYSNREKYLANMFGFEQFIPVKKTGIKTGEFGYWIVEISPYL